MCVCVCVAHTLVMERNDTVIAVFSPPPPFLSRARLKVCVGKKKNMCVCSNVCVCASEVCVSLTAASSLSPATYRENRDGTINQGHTHTHTRIHTHIYTIHKLSRTHTQPDPAVVLRLLFLVHFCAHTHKDIILSHYTRSRPT